MTTEAEYADWIAVDWGTSNLRAWAMRRGSAIAEVSSDQGMSSLAPEAFEPTLLSLIEPWLGTARMTVVACGMVGARQGWAEAAYQSVPCPPVGAGATRPLVKDPRLEVYILPGLSQSSPPDVMRGEETQIAGFLSDTPDFDGILCLPGTHTKWAQISAGEVVSFRTFMTGELFALISKQSVLRHSIDDSWNDGAFAEAVRDGMADPQALAGRFFGLRAAGLLSDPVPGDAASRLSGLLLGAELSAARAYWLGQRVALLGAQKLNTLYATSLSAEGVTAETADASRATLTGLSAAYARLKETI